MRIYIIRHADPDYPNDSITDQGHREADALAKRLEAVGLNRIYTSPLGRAKLTASYTAHRVGLKPSVEPWTREHTWTTVGTSDRKAHSPWNYPGEVFRAESDVPTFDNWSQMPPLDADTLGEEFAALGAASDDFLRRQGYEREGRRYRCIQPNLDRIAVFCHGGFGLTWLAYLLEIPLPVMWSGFWLPPTSVSMILMEQRSDEWAVPRCIGLGDTSHLYASGLEIQPRGLLAENWENAALETGAV